MGWDCLSEPAPDPQLVSTSKILQLWAAEVRQLSFPSAVAGSTPIHPLNLRTWLWLSPSGARHFLLNEIINDQSSMTINRHQYLKIIKQKLLFCWRAQLHKWLAILFKQHGGSLPKTDLVEVTLRTAGSRAPREISGVLVILVILVILVPSCPHAHVTSHGIPWNPMESHGIHVVHQVAGNIFRIPWIPGDIPGIRWIRGWAAGLRSAENDLTHNRHNQTWSQQIQICSKYAVKTSKKTTRSWIEIFWVTSSLMFLISSEQFAAGAIPEAGDNKSDKRCSWEALGDLLLIQICQDMSRFHNSISGTVSHKGFCFFDFWIRASFGWELEHQKTKNCFSSS